jgi:hypothetical protein
MQANRILPDLQCSLLCEEVRQEINGNLMLIGVINLIRVIQLPIIANRLCIYNCWTAGLGQFTETVRILAPDQMTVLRKGEMKFELKDVVLRAPNVLVFGQIEFKTAGIYYIEVLVDDVMKIRYPLPISIAPQPGENPGAAPAV